jgi:molybdenum cofactor cytidylyltransferase
VTTTSLAIVPAAGRSERFGGMKLLADVEHEPLLNRTLRSVLDAPMNLVVVVMAPDASLPGVPLLDHERVRVVTNPDPARGMFSSIQTGLAAASGDPIAILPADMPFVQSATIARLVLACREAGAAIVPVHGGRRGHPLVVPARWRDALRSADARSNLKRALRDLGVDPREVPVEDAGVLRDVDTRADLDGRSG